MRWLLGIFSVRMVKVFFSCRGENNLPEKLAKMWILLQPGLAAK